MSKTMPDVVYHHTGSTVGLLTDISMLTEEQQNAFAKYTRTPDNRVGEAERAQLIAGLFPDLGGITLGSELEGKITEAQAVSLVNNVLIGYRTIAEGTLKRALTQDKGGA